MDIKKWANSRYSEDIPSQKSEALESTLSILKKAKDPSAWDAFYHDASETLESGQDKVDPSVHLSTSKKFPDYMQALNDPKIKVDHPTFREGTYGKMLHSHDGDKYMMKPYYNHMDHSTGWNTIAIKGLYNKAGLADKSEGVGTDEVEHEGIKMPVNISKFAKGYTVRGSAKKPVVNLRDASKIALMDYLVDNFDRHDQNIMISDRLNDEGYNDLLAIDHDLSFDYGRQGMLTSSNPADHYAYQVFEKIGSPESLDHEDIRHLALWWKDSSPKMKVEMLDHLKAIKKESLKSHIHKNFYQRAEALDRWADNALKDPHSNNPFSGSVEDVSDIPMEHEGDYDFNVFANISRVAEEDPVKAFDLITNDLQNRNYNEEFGDGVAEYLSGHLDQLRPPEIADILQKPMTTPASKRFKNQILIHLINMADNGDRNSVGVLNYLRDVNSKLSSDRQFLHPIWSFAIDRIIR